ncbi:MAG: hypothetical protein BA863_15385 [Desulfovibrio sp. S3730MH75]|nr:MAG: hypothetical protein BA863_15385 [Desulfovibrio sp. S3730MH75]
MKYASVLFLVFIFYVSAQSLACADSSQTWNTNFQGELRSAQAVHKQGQKLTNRQLYALGRGYIRKKYEDNLVAIERQELRADSQTLVLKQVYKFFNYCNPLNLTFPAEMSTFDSPVNSNSAMLVRWRGLYNQAVSDATSMFDYGDKMYGPQVYELGRAMFLYKLHSPKPDSQDAEFTPQQWELLRRAFHILSYLNSPGGPDLGYAPDFGANTNPKKNKDNTWDTTEQFLHNNRDTLGIGNGLISFLVGSTSAWEATSFKLPDPPTEQAVMSFATHANMVLSKAASAYTDIQNKENALNNPSQVFANFVSGDSYASFLPPAIRVHFLRTSNTPGEPAPLQMALNMTGFEGNARLYGLEGWQGIAKKFQQSKAQSKLTLDDFSDYLCESYVLLEQPELGRLADAPLEPFLKGAEGEAKLGDIFSTVSIFSLW